MARKLIKSESNTNPMATLEELVPAYAKAKGTADEYKKIADEQNKKIKTELKAIKDESQTLEIAGFTVNFQKQERTSINEEMLMEKFKNAKKLKLAKDLGIIKTKEYVDFDALESAIYNESIPEKLVASMKDCEEVKIVEVLKITSSSK